MRQQGKSWNAVGELFTNRCREPITTARGQVLNSRRLWRRWPKLQFAHVVRFSATFAFACVLVAGVSSAGKTAPWPSDQSCGASPHYDVEFSGNVVADQSYHKHLSKNYAFGLQPLSDGWFVEVFYLGRQVLITVPFYPDARPYDIEGWHFRNSDNTGPNELGPKNVNAEQRKRFLMYSPQCWSGGQPRCSSEHDLSVFKGTISCFTVTVESMELGNLVPKMKANIKRMSFTVRFAYAEGFPR